MKRVVVLGAGAIGASVGALLSEAGAEVVLVARGEHGRAMASHGIDLRLPTSSRTVRLPCVETLALAAPTADDLVVVATMGHHTEAALGTLPPEVPVASFQNGVAPIEAIVRRGHPTLVAMLYVPAERRGAAKIALQGTPHFGTVLLGAWPHEPVPEALVGWTNALVAKLGAAGFDAEAVVDVAPWIYAKLLVNLAGIVVALSDEPAADVIEAARDEARAVLVASGTPFFDVDALVNRVGTVESAVVDGIPRVGGSTRAALARGEPLETRSLHGTVLELGLRTGIRTPVNGALVALAERASSSGISPGSMTAEDLRAAVFGARR